MARGATARMRHGAEATWQGRGWHTRGARGAHGADTWQEATRVHAGHADSRVGRHMAGRGVGIWRAHGLVGPGKIVGAVTRKRYTAPQFKLNFFKNFFHVGLCPTRFLPFVGDVDARQASDSIRTTEIAWTRVDAIVNQARARNPL